MGATVSRFSPNAKIYCEKHPKEASAFCLSHKKSICMSCIVQKDHSNADCKLQEMEFVDCEVKECLRIKQLLRKYNSKLDAHEIERDMKLEIEAAYSEALAKLEQCKSLSYEVTRREVAKLIENNKQCHARTLHELDTAIDKYISGKRIEGNNIKKDIMNKRFTTGITFQKHIPSFHADGNYLVSAREDIYVPDRYSDYDRLTKERANLPFKSHCKTVVESDDPNDVVDGKHSGDMTT